MFFFANNFDLSTFFSFLFVAIFAFAYHEYAHAIVANALGDPTPKKYGRLSLNPIVHLDFVGLLMLVLVGFGFASTPVNPSLMRGNRRVSHALVAVAGPVANLIMAILFAIPIWLSQAGIFSFATLPTWVFGFVQLGVFLNIFLMVFNLMPLPPLDGFTIVLGFLPDELSAQLEQLRRYGFMIILLVFFLLPNLGPSFDIFNQVLRPISNFFFDLLGLGSLVRM